MSEQHAFEDARIGDVLERELDQLRHAVAFPETPAITAAVRVRIAETPPPTNVKHRTRLLTHPWLTATAIVLLAALAALTSSSVRHTVADLLGVPGIRIEFEDETPTVQPSPAVVTVGLGDRTTLGVAAGTEDMPVLVPDSGTFGAPDDVYLRVLPNGQQMVTLLYLPDDGLPEAAETGVGLLFMQFKASARVEIMVKSVMGEGSAQQVLVNGDRGFWIEGTSELEILNDPSAPTCCTDEPRPSANVLLWQADGVTYRLESALDRSESIALAESMTPFEAPTEP